VQRTHEQLRQHFDVERELADKLRSANADERRTLYNDVYDELFRRVPDHPQLHRVDHEDDRREFVEFQMRLLRRFLTPETTMFEIGAGDCAITILCAESVRRAYAVEVSEEIATHLELPANAELVISDGTTIPIEPGSANLAYSNQLMEHLHPDDARRQLESIAKALAPGGRYLCITPNRRSGPHDISKHFANEACGFHMKEYTASELKALFRQSGFGKVEAWGVVKGRYMRVPWLALRALETFMAILPHALRRRLARVGPIEGVLGLYLVASKV